MKLFLSVPLIIVTLGVAILSSMPGAKAVGTPLYPDLQPLEASSLSLAVVTLADGRAHNVLRFSTTMANTGAGRLELEGKKRSKVYQNVYDAAVGGTLVEKNFIGNDSVFHQGHNHYHIENFASYMLLKKEAGSSAYTETSSRGTKTSFCLLDMVSISGSNAAQYVTCGRTFQGISVGWADVYGAHLVDQWIDLGIAQAGVAPLADGDYAVRIIANPATGSAQPKIKETNFTNNTSIKYFRVSGGQLAQ